MAEREAMSKGRASARDVAQLAGVSTATVSRALNLPQQVEPETLRRVREAVVKLRYVPHGAARSLRSHRSRMVGAVVPSFDYALYARTTSALQRALDAAGYALVLAEHHYDLAAELRITQQLVEHGVDAFVFVGVDHDPALFALLEDYGRPYVLTWGVDASQRHGNDRARERGAGVREALAEAGLDLPDERVAYGAIALGAAQAAMARLLALPKKRRPTAVVATNDVFAVGAMLACRAAGVTVPQQMSITGVDNTDLGATQTPGLTSVRTPVVEIGSAAAEQLVARLEGRPAVMQQSLAFELVVRGSTAPPAD